MRVVNGGVLTHAPVGETGIGLDLQVSGEVFVDAASAIDVSAKGHAAGRTLDNSEVGAATGRSGGSYGGLGFTEAGETNRVYGDFRDPRQPGSGAARDLDNGGAGGGVIRITAATLRLEGRISADGGDGIDPYPNGGGGGSGGGISIDVDMLRGGGAISAAGGRGVIHCYYGCRFGGSGGGGRIAVRYATNSGFDLSKVTALGGDNETYDAGPGASGTVYLQRRGYPSELHVRGSVSEPGAWTPLGEPGDDWIALDRLTISGPGVVAAPEHDMPIVAQNIALENGAVLTHRPASSHEWFALRLLVSGTLSIDAASAIDVSGRGYRLGRGAGNRWLGAAGNLGGGSCGGRGGYSSNFPYGEATNPDEPGSGGAVGSGGGGAGGGLVRLSAGAMTLDGAIRANGSDGRNEERGQPAGSGGGVLLNVGVLSGSGSISADGGRNGVVCYYGCRFGGSGGGGRVAIYSQGGSGIGPEQVTAAGGSGEIPGAAGTIERPTVARFVWSLPVDSLLQGIEPVAWEGLGVDSAGSTVEVTAVGAQTFVLGTNLPWTGVLRWDTTAVPGGRYELRATFRGASGATLGVARRTVLVENTLPVHGGRIATSASWGAGAVHVVARSVSVASGSTLTIEPGAIVKFAPGTGISLEDGATLQFTGSAAAPIVLTSLTDDTVGGDTNRDGGASLPRHGEWDGLRKIGTGQANLDEHVSLRYARMAHSARLTAAETWSAESVHEVIDDVVVGAGVMLAIAPGARVEFGFARGMSLEVGGRLDARGSLEHPIVFTSTRDGWGDSAPEAGDWHWIDVAAGEADLEHCRIRYGGGTATGEWEQTGVIRTFGSSATLTLRNSTVEDAFFDGVLVWGGQATLENVLLKGIDRAVSAHPGGVVQVTNCTVDDNRIGLLVHGGEMNVVNSIVTNSYESGVQYDFGSQPVVRYSDIWSAAPGAVNYLNTADQTGSNGNLSIDPRYRDRARGTYRLAHLSPAIDAADGTAAPPADALGAARYDDPRSANTGTPTATGAFADLGAYEFVESADSDVDLVVVDVRGPTRATVGERVLIEWTVYNDGTGPAVGPWRDTIYLVMASGQETIEVEVAEVEVGGGPPLGAGESRTFQAEVILPGALAGDHDWQVRTNSHGDVFEGRNHDNNGGRSIESVSVDMLILPLDATVEGDFAAGRESFWYAFFAPFGTEYELELALDREAPPAAIHARRNWVATRHDYDWRTPPEPTTLHRLRIPAGPEGYVYVLVTIAGAPASPLHFSLRLTRLGSFDLSGVDPETVCNTGEATLALHGSGFSPRSVARLIRNGEEIEADRMLFADSMTLYATFTVRDLSEGRYDIAVRDDRLEIGAEGSVTVVELSARQDGALTITRGEGGKLGASLSTRSVQRSGRPFDLLLKYRNTGCADLVAPLLLVRAAGARFLIEEEPFLFADAAQVMGMSSVGPAGRLRAGQQETVRLVVTPPREVASFEITVAPAAEGPGGPDFNAIAGFLELPLDTEWGQSVLGNLRALTGETWASYESALVRALDESYERRTPSVAALLEHLAAASTPPLAAAARIEPRHDHRQDLLPPATHPPPPGHTRFDPWPTGPDFDFDAARVDQFKSALQFIATHAILYPPWVPGGLHLQHFLNGSGTTLSYGPTDYFTETLKEDPSFRQYLRSGDWRKDVRSAAKVLAESMECGQATRMNVQLVTDLPESGGGAMPGWMDAPGGQAIGGVDKAVIDLDVYVMRRENDIQVVGRGRVQFSDFYHWAGHAWYHKSDYDPPWNWWACYLEYWGAAKGFAIEVDFGDILIVEETISGETVPRKDCDKIQFIPEPPPGFVVDATGVHLAGSYDPNEKLASGSGSLGWLRDDPLILYTVRFENKSTASAPAQEVVVTDQLSPDLDWASFELEAIGFNDRLIEVPSGHQSYAAMTEVGSDPNPVRVQAEIDPGSGLVVLRLRSEDPATRDLPDDPLGGFLPPNDDEHHGEGFIRFTLKPRGGLPDGTRIRNQARIVFDVNEPIDTDSVINTIGFPPPECTGDCDGGGVVTIDELIKGVNIALGNTPLGECAVFDRNTGGQVTIDELIGGVNNAIAGCAVPTPRPTSTPTRTQPTASVTPTRTRTLTPTRTRSATASPTTTPSRTFTSTRSPTATPTHTLPPLATPSPTTTPSRTPTATQTPTATPTHTIPPPATATPSATATSSPSPTPTLTGGPTGSPTPTPTGTPNPTPTVFGSETLVYCDEDLSLAIPDNDLFGVASFIDVPDDIAIEHIEVRVQISHSWVGDLGILLDHIDTLNSATLLDRPGVPATSSGCSKDDILCTFADAAPSPAEDQCSDSPLALSGTLRPSSPLGAFQGERSIGTWMLAVIDSMPGDTGSLHRWCLELRGPP